MFKHTFLCKKYYKLTNSEMLEKTHSLLLLTIEKFQYCGMCEYGEAGYRCNLP